MLALLYRAPYHAPVGYTAVEMRPRGRWKLSMCIPHLCCVVACWSDHRRHALTLIQALEGLVEEEALGSYVLVEKEDVLDAIGTFVAAYLATVPEAQHMKPAELQQALTSTFRVSASRTHLNNWKAMPVCFCSHCLAAISRPLPYIWHQTCVANQLLPAMVNHFMSMPHCLPHILVELTCPASCACCTFTFLLHPAAHDTIVNAV